jgi:hypothetical protein
MRGSSERDIRDLARKLAEGESSEPPAGLLEKIKAEIPPEIRIGTAVPATVSPRFMPRRSVPRQRWLIAASLVAAIGAGLVGLRTWQTREEGSLKVEARLAAPQSAAAKATPPPAAPPASEAAPPPPERVQKLGGEAQGRVAPPPPPPPAPVAPKPEALKRRDLESSPGYLSDQKLKAQPAQPPQPVEAPENLPAPSPARAACPPAEKDTATQGLLARGAAAGAESEAQRQEARAKVRSLAKQLQQPEEERDKKEKKTLDAYDAVHSEPAGTDPFLDASTYRLSTFGLGVGTASYDQARRDLAAGHLPDPASVRVEEWLSYFDYGDPAPAGREDFAIRAEGAPSPFAHGPEYRLLRFNIKARLTGTLQTAVAQNARAQVEFNAVVVERYRLLGFENRAIPDKRFRDESVDAGPIVAGRSVTALYEIELRKGAPHWEQPVATLHLRYQVPGRANVIETLRQVSFQSFAPAWEQASPALRLAALVAEMAEILKGSPWARQADLGDVARRIREVAPQFPGDGKVAELAALARRAARIKAGLERPEE